MEEEFEGQEETTEVIEGANEGAEEENSEAPEEGEAGEESEGEEEGENAEEKGQPDHKKNAQDRIQQLANEKRELANEKRELAERLGLLESQFAKQQEEKPDFFDVDMDKVNSYIQTTTDQIEEYKLEGNYLAARKLEANIIKIIGDLEANDKKREAYLERQNKSKTATTASQERLQKLDNAAEFYRENQKIDKPVWDKMGTWFAEQCQKDPVLGREFAERVEKGEIGAIRFAHEYATKNMGAKERAAIEAKNTNKEKAAAASPIPGGKSAPVDLSKALAKATELNTTEGWVEYQALKRAAKR